MGNAIVEVVRQRRRFGCPRSWQFETSIPRVSGSAESQSAAVGSALQMEFKMRRRIKTTVRNAAGNLDQSPIFQLISRAEPPYSSRT